MPLEMNPTWEVDLLIVGPIAVEHRMSLRELKGMRNIGPFYSDIHMQPASGGVKATLTAHARNADLARKASLVFFGQMLDALTLSLNLPMQLISLRDAERIRFTGSVDVRRRVLEHEWHTAFQDARWLSHTYAPFLRALGWYRKASYTDEPFDAFLAYWNAIEVVASEYHPPIPEGKTKGSKSKIWECFKVIWDECDKWPHIPSNVEWIDTHYQTRVDVAHGVANVDIKAIEEVLNRLGTLRLVAYQFLSDWHMRQLNREGYYQELALDG